METKITHNKNGTVTFEGEIPSEGLTKHRGAALKKLGAAVKVDGFREGHVPENILAEHVGDGALLEEMANRALSEHYPLLLAEHKIDAIGRPEVTVTKLAVGNPLGFKITTAILPKVELPDYKALAQSALKKVSDKPEDVKDADIDQVVVQLLQEKNKADGKEEKEAPKASDMTDDVAKTYGPFETTAELRDKIKEGMEAERMRAVLEKKRAAMLDAILAKTKLTLPDVLIDAELNKLLAQFSYDIERMGMKKEQYLEAIKKTEDDLRKDFRPDAEKRAKTQLILNQIAIAENIKPDAAAVKKEVDHLLSHHAPHAGHDEAQERQSAEIYVTTILMNQSVLEFLEKGVHNENK